MENKKRKRRNMHGSSLNPSRHALLIIDVINDLEFPGGEKLARQVKKISSNISILAQRARAAKVPILYINDNFNQWKSSFQSIIEHCSDQRMKGHKLVSALKPSPGDYFIIKPEKSAFYHTPLSILLKQLKTQALILTGLTTDSCIYLSACEAHMRDYKIFVPRDCVMAIEQKDHHFFLNHMRKNLRADIRASLNIAFNSYEK